MLGDMRGRVVIVTGAGQGIGEGIARVFARAGAGVVVAVRSAGNGQGVVDGGSTLPESQVVMDGFYSPQA